MDVTGRVVDMAVIPCDWAMLLLNRSLVMLLVVTIVLGMTTTGAPPDTVGNWILANDGLFVSANGELQCEIKERD